MADTRPWVMRIRAATGAWVMPRRRRISASRKARCSARNCFIPAAMAPCRQDRDRTLRGTHPGCSGGTRCCSSDVLLFQVVLVTLLGQRDRLAVPGLPFASLISGYQQDRVPPGIEEIQDADLAAPGGAWPQFLQVGQPGVLDAIGEWVAQLRPGFEQHADGLADLDRAGPVTLAQVVQPRPDLRCHDQDIGHVSCLSAAVALPRHNIT